MRKQPPYDPLTDFSPISFIGNYTFFLVVNSALPIRTLGELIAYAKANPGKLNYATGNATGIVAMGQLMSLTGIQMVHVPYKGEPAAVVDLVGGRVDLMFATPTTTLMFVRQGKLRALATTNRMRSPLAPETPTMAEAGLSKLSFAPWGGVFGPAGIPKEVADRLSREIAAAFRRPEVREAIEKQALEFAPSTPEELGAFLKEQLEVWRGVVRDLNIQRD